MDGDGTSPPGSCHPVRPSGEHLGPYFAVDLDDDIGRQAVALGGDADRLDARRLVQAVGPHLVGAQEREEPLHALLVVDAHDAGGTVLVELDLLGEPSFDQVSRHGLLRPQRPRSSCALRWSKLFIPIRSAAATAMLRISAARSLSSFRPRANSMRA